MTHAFINRAYMGVLQCALLRSSIHAAAPARGSVCILMDRTDGDLIFVDINPLLLLSPHSMIYIHTYIHMHTYTHTYIHTYIHGWMRGGEETDGVGGWMDETGRRDGHSK